MPTPATEVPGAMRTSDDAMSATTAVPAARPIHTGRRLLRAAGSAGAQAYIGAVSAADASGTFETGGTASARGRVGGELGLRSWRVARLFSLGLIRGSVARR